MTIFKLLLCAEQFTWIISFNPYQGSFTTITTYNKNYYFIHEETEAKRNEITSLSNWGLVSRETRILT